jgi:hypothetical protein
MRRAGKLFVGLIVLILTLPYAAAPLYTILPAEPFQGNRWHNPYTSADSHWVKANVHVHSQAWLGTTDGRKNSVAAVDSAYRTLGYNVLALSNYQRITPLEHGWEHLPCYEHGYNVQKTHQLALGADQVIWLDCILPQTLFVKQWLLDVLRPTCQVLIAAHPAFGRPSYYPSDMAFLSNYDCIEVFNHYRTSLAHWDTALSNGITVWAVGNDDCHDVSSSGETGVCLTLVFVPPAWSARDVYHSYQRGATIAVRTRHGQLPIGIPRQMLRNDSLVIELDAAADSVRFITTGGKPYASAKAGTLFSVPLASARGYVRAEVYAGSTVYALNPIVQGELDHQQRRMQENQPLTLLYRLVCGLIYANGIVLLRARKRR